LNTPPWSQDLIKNLIEVVKTGILIIDTQGTIRFANHYAAELLGFPQDALNEKSIEIFFLPEDSRIFLPNILKLTRESNGFEGEVMLSKRDGIPFFVNLSSALYQEASTGHEFIILTLQDITCFKKMGEEQLETERFFGLGRMTDQISHQIRNPLTSIGGFAQRLAREPISREDCQRYTQIIQNEARRLEHILDRLVEFARVQPTRFVPYTLPEIFAGVEKSVPSKEEAAALRWPDLEKVPNNTIYGNPDFISRAVQCLIQNGLEACSNQGEVMVTGELTENQILIRIKDNGDGILPENLPFIFDPFFSTKFNYLGLGLTMAKRIVQVHQGQIKVKSVPGQGSEFRLLLPKDRRREIRTRLI
jgi:PAS domain S-box-containing protein